MIDAVVGWSVARPRLVPALVLIAALGAVATAGWLRFDALPDVTGRQILVLSRAPGLTPEEVERLVTRPIELAIGGVPGLSRQRSVSRYGISSVTAVFDDQVDILQARQLVAERLVNIRETMPEGVEPPELGPLTGGLGEIYHFTVSSPERTPAELLELVDLRVAPLLRAVPGVVEVNSWGGARRTMDVVADPVRMARRRVMLGELASAAERATGQAPGATLEAGESGVLLRAVSWPARPAELAMAVVRLEPDGSMIRIGDVAEVVEGARPRLGAATSGGRGETVYVMAQMLLDANALDVMGRVHEQMGAVRAALPSDVTLEVVYDRSELVEATLRTVFSNLLLGGLLVVVVLFLWLGSFRAGALVAAVIPLSMLFALAGMVALDIPGNLMSLGALDFGLLVDGAVVMVEAVFYAVHVGGGPMEERIHEATVKMARPVFFSLLIVLLVYVPILGLSGVEGRLFRPMAMTVALAVGAALLLTMVLVPAGARLLLRESDVPARSPWLVRLAARAYAPVLDLALARPVIVSLGAIALLAIGGALFYRSGSAFVPQLDEGDLVVQTTREPDIRIESAVAAASRMEAAIREVPEVLQVATRTGSPEVATDLMGLEQADVFIALRPRGEWREGLTRAALIHEIDEAIASSSPARDVAFTQPIQMRFNELLGGSVTDVTVSFIGEDLSAITEVAEQAAALLEGVRGAEDVRVLAPPAVRSLEVRPRPLEAARHGLTNRDVMDHVQALRAGLDVGATYDGPVRVPVRIRLGADIQATTIEQMPVLTAEGSLVPLERVAVVAHQTGPSLVNREMAERRAVVGLNVRDRDLGSVVEDARARLDTLPLPEGVRSVWGGQYESLESARARLGVIVPSVLVMMFALLAALFREWRLPLIILLHVPFAAVGGIVALSARGLPLSVSAMVGFIALSGIAITDGVVLVSAVRDEYQTSASMIDAVRAAASTRMRPVLMTSLVAGLGFLPMTLATGVGAEVQRPLATVVVGGIITSTLLTLVVLPAVLPRLYGARAPLGPSAPPPSPR